MNLSVIIQARLRSTRLPGKVLLSLPNRMSVLENVIGRCVLIDKRNLHSVCVAVPDDEQGDIIEDHVEFISQAAATQFQATSSVCKIDVVRGSESDVLDRYAKAAAVVGGGHIMRITADCPFIDPAICTAVANSHYENSNDITSNVVDRTFPKGFDCEVFTRDALELAMAAATDPYDREHVTPWMYRNLSVGSVIQEKDESTTNLCIDTIDDYISLCRRMICS